MRIINFFKNLFYAIFGIKNPKQIAKFKDGSVTEWLQKQLPSMFDKLMHYATKSDLFNHDLSIHAQDHTMLIGIIKGFFHTYYSDIDCGMSGHEISNAFITAYLREEKSDEPFKIDLSKKKLGFLKKKVREYSMRNNRLIIEYNGESKQNGRNFFLNRYGKNGKRIVRMRPGSMYKDRIDSMRCTRLNRAEEIVRSIQKYCIYRAIFKDAAGNEFKLI